MIRANDRWERLVEAVLDREKLRELALADSRESSFRSSFSSSSFSSNDSFRFDVEFDTPPYIATTGRGRDISVPIHLTHQVIKGADAATLFKQDCVVVKLKTQQLELLLQQVAAFASDLLYDRPARRIMEDTLKVIHLALVLVTKCQRGGLRQRLFTKITTAAIHGISSQLENSIRNVSWLLRVDEYSLGTGIPPIVTAEPILFKIWEVITILHTGSTDDKCDAAVSLIALIRDDNNSFRKLFIEEDGVLPLSRILKEGMVEGQENAARALVWLVQDPKNIRDIEDLFCSILEEAPANLKAAVAWGISEIAERNQLFNLYEEAAVKGVEWLVSHLALNGVQIYEENGAKEKELIYAIAAKALSNFIKLGNDTICSKIVHSRAIFHLANLLDNGPKESRYAFLMTLMEITELAEKYDFIQSYFQPNLLVCKAIVDLFVKVTHEEEDSKFLVPCIKIFGNLAMSFEVAKEVTMIIISLLELLEKVEVCVEACITLIKFVEIPSSNIIIVGKAKHFVQLVKYSRDEIVQINALILLCHLTQHMPESKELVDAGVHTTLEWARQRKPFAEDKEVEILLKAALSDFNYNYRR